MILKSIGAILGLIVVGAALYVRFAPSSPTRWHVDPLNAEINGRLNVFLQKPDQGKDPSQVFDMDAARLAAAFDAVIMASPNTTRLAGSPKDLFVTYIARTPVMRYPDYITIKFLDGADGTSTYAVYSRSRFGIGDQGVNKKRFLGWLEDLSR